MRVLKTLKHSLKHFKVNKKRCYDDKFMFLCIWREFTKRRAIRASVSGVSGVRGVRGVSGVVGVLAWVAWVMFLRG